MKKGFLILVLTFSFFVFLARCKKDDEITKETISTEVIESNLKDTIRVNYSVVLVPAGTSSLKKSKSLISNANISVVRNGEVISNMTDENGVATFENLRSGVITVVIKATNYTPVSLLVDLGSNDMENQTDYRNASTMVGLLPISGDDFVNISGTAKAQLDVKVTFDESSTDNSSYVENADLEFVPSGTELLAIIDPESINSLVSTTGNGKVQNVAYEGIMYKGTVDENGQYSIKVPMTYKGLKYMIYPTNFRYAIKYSARQKDTQNNYIVDSKGNYVLVDKTEKHVFNSGNSEITIFVVDKYIDFIWTYNGSIEDANYFGTIY